MSGRRTSEPTFDVWPTPHAAAQLGELRGRHRRSAARAREEFERIGCRAAHYRLSGEGVERICVRRLGDNMRMVVGFPAENEVAILLVGPHDRENPELDVYLNLYKALGVDVPDAEHRRPACCDDGEPTVDTELLERILEQSRRLLE